MPHWAGGGGVRLSRVLTWQHWSQGNTGVARGPSRAHLRTPQVLVHGKPETRTEKVNKTRKETFSGWFEFCQGQEPAASRPSWWDAAPARLLPPRDPRCQWLSLATRRADGLRQPRPLPVVRDPGELVFGGCAPAFLTTGRHTCPSAHARGRRAGDEENPSPESVQGT